MSRTIPTKFVGTPVLTLDKVAIITEWYHGALGDADKGDDVYDVMYDEGQADAYEVVLSLLHNTTAKVKPKRNILGIAIVVGVSIVAYRVYKADKEKRDGETTG